MSDASTAETEAPDTLTIPLVPPVSHKGGILDALHLREPTLGEVRLAEALMKALAPSPADERAYQQKLVSLVAGIAPDAVGDLPASKLVQAVQFLEGFILAPAPDAAGEGTAANPPWAFDSNARPDALTVELDPPIEQQRVSYDAVALREPTARQVEAAETKLKAQRSPADIRDYHVALLQSVSGLPVTVVRALPIRKAMEGVRYLEGFLRPARATGAS